VPALYRHFLQAMWLSWAAYWWVSSRNVKRTARRESLPSRLSHIAPLALASLLFSLPNSLAPFFSVRFSPSATWPFKVAVVLTAAGLLFAVWARQYLGSNWSGTGLLLALVGSAMAIGECEQSSPSRLRRWLCGANFGWRNT
jgi:protein-S-isoprenylcysteine O-methyltransferase Ste14